MNLNYTFIINEYSKAFPKLFMHSHLKKQYELGFKDPLHQTRVTVNTLYWQGVLSIIQIANKITDRLPELEDNFEPVSGLVSIIAKRAKHFRNMNIH